MKRILIIRLRYIGDVLLTVPAIRAVRERFPESKITYLANPGTGMVLEGNPLVDEIIDYDYKHKISFLNQLRKRRFDMVIDMAGYDRSAIASFMTNAKYRIAPKIKGEGFFGKKYCYTHLAKSPDSMKHKVEQYLSVVQEFGMTTQDLSIPIFLRAEEKEFVNRLFQQEKINPENIVVHCHPVARYMEKIWAYDKMAQTIDYLQEKGGCQVIVTCSSSEEDIRQINQIKKYIKTQPIFLIGKTTVRQVAAISARSNLFFGLDSGIMHIAAAMGTPVVALFGSSSVIHWRPWGERHIVISDQRLDQPYKHPQPTLSGLNPFLEQLQVQEVIKILDKKLNEIKQ
jgi:heptosyltransferase III